jgi:release factor glutamine methyltransferase
MIIRSKLNELTSILTENNIEEPKLEASLLIRGALSLDDVQLYLKMNDELSSNELNEIDRRLETRLSGIPAAYILGYKEFFGRTFIVNENVLIPRPETETLIEDAIASFKGKKCRLLDVGTGSGVIGITLSLELPYADVTACDISDKALDTAKTNNEKLCGKVLYKKSDLLNDIDGKYDGILANLPYVPTSDIPDSHEPDLALDGGNDGLNVIRRLIPELPLKINRPGIIWLELAINQYPEVSDLLRNVFPESLITPVKDLAGIDRFAKCEIK